MHAMTFTKSLLNTTHAQMIFGRRIRILADLLAEEIPAGARVLDVGAGDGSLARSMASNKPGITVEGIDVLIRPTAHIPVKRFDGVRIPYEDRSVDVAMFVDVLHHTTDPAALLREAARVAKFVVIKDHLREGMFANSTLRLMDWIGNYGHGVTLPYNYLARAEWHEMFARTNLNIERWRETLGIYPWPISMVADRRLHFIGRLAV